MNTPDPDLRPRPEQLARAWPAEPTGWTRQPFFTCNFDDAGRPTTRPQTQPSSQPATRPDDVTGGTNP